MRKKEWLACTIETVEERRFVPFKWGFNDCATFACDVMLAQTGVDYAESFRHKYKTGLGAARELLRFAGGGLKETAEKICSENNFLTIKPARAKIGDLIYFRTCLLGNTPRDVLGVYYEDNIVATGIEGLAFLDPRGVIKAWRSV